jgi:putative redox protein
MNEVTVISTTNFQNEVRYGDGQSFVIDEPQSAGGDSAGPDPYTLLLAALGGCTSLTVTMYARRKGWNLKRVTVRLKQERIHARDCADCEIDEDAYVHRIELAVMVEGDLNDEQRARLIEIAGKCPVHKTLTSPIVIKEAAASS